MARSSESVTDYTGRTVAIGDRVSLDETCLRFASSGQWDHGRPTTAALSLGKDEDGISIYLKDLLASKALSPSAVLTDRPRHGLFAFAVSVAANCGCPVTHDPCESDPPQEIDFAHALMGQMDKAEWLTLRLEILKLIEVLHSPPESGR